MKITIACIFIALALIYAGIVFAKTTYHSCPYIGYGSTLTYGADSRYPGWRVFHQGAAESISFEQYTMCNVTKKYPNSNQEINCYFSYKDNVDGYQVANGLSGTMTHSLPNNKNCHCVDNNTAKCVDIPKCPKPCVKPKVVKCVKIPSCGS